MALLAAHPRGSLNTSTTDTLLHSTLAVLEKKISQRLSPLSPFTHNRSPLVRSQNTSAAKICSPKKQQTGQLLHTDIFKLLSNYNSDALSIPFQPLIPAWMQLISLALIICLLLHALGVNKCLFSEDLPCLRSLAFVFIYRVHTETPQKQKKARTLHCRAAHTRPRLRTLRECRELDYSQQLPLSTLDAQRYCSVKKMLGVVSHSARYIAHTPRSFEESLSPAAKTEKTATHTTNTASATQHQQTHTLPLFTDGVVLLFSLKSMHS